MADNLDQTTGNQDQTTEVNENEQQGTQTTNPTPATETTTEQAPGFSWKGKAGADLSKAPAMEKFADTEEGLAELGKSYVNLEKLLGHEKVPLPKGPEDAEGRAAFNKAIGVPATPNEYNLPDAELPEAAQGMTFDKGSFQEIVHKYGLTPGQAQGLWTEYTKMSGDLYGQHMEQYKQDLDKNINALRKEWGDAYPGNIELGDLAIAKLADSQEMGDWLTATLSKNPYGMKFLAKVGNTFAENKIGDFQYKRYGLTPEEAQKEMASIRNNPDHPYNNENAPQKDRDAAIDHVNRLLAKSLGKSL